VCVCVCVSVFVSVYVCLFAGFMTTCGSDKDDNSQSEFDCVECCLH
jgi:hypothetical protein